MSDNKQQFEIDEDSGHQQVEWKTERAGWIVSALVLSAALLGLLGPGPLSSVNARSSDQQLDIQYNRIRRRMAESDIVVRISPGAARTGPLRLRISSNFIEYEAIERIQPRPHEVVSAGAAVTHVFAVLNTPQPIVITLRGKPTCMGRHDYIFGIEGGPEVRFWTFVLP